MSTSPAVQPDASRVMATTLDRYPVGTMCSAPDALTKEQRSLPPKGAWKRVSARRERLSMSVPPGVFELKDETAGSYLVSKLAARGLGEPPVADYVFGIRFSRLSRSIDDVLSVDGQRRPLQFTGLDQIFPSRTEASFVARPTEDVGAGFTARTTVAGHTAYVWVHGEEGYNADYVLVRLKASETLLVVARWNSAIMGQPECWQRQVIAGVIDSITAEE